MSFLQPSVASALGPEGRALWLFLRNDGGWWSVETATHHWRPTFSESQLRELLEALHLAGYLETRPLRLLTATTMTYAVTSNCSAFPGLQLLQQEGCAA